MKVRAIELLMDDGLVRVAADGTPGWIVVKTPDNESFAYDVRTPAQIVKLASDIATFDRSPNFQLVLRQIVDVIW